ncbi:thiol oxidoreductase [Pseudooceanicola sp. 216_PA32_1]|uniref:Thiol oxidoreductase n=1 Tax=Pseudooceanicola pacificus TaxID=2676438 RepID=A0A844W840_9RHOB|nr:di-heme oxidoredictase family protein [Pseudooceanicola pacificus]MWB79305.1 thiol oxidoreductase [Pseudooceanicola pacificus]
MPNSTRRRWTKPSKRFACLLLACLPAAVAAADLASDPHLDTIPRSADDAARIARVTEPATDFTAPERFEGNPAGAATVRARDNADAFSQPSGNMSFENELLFKVGNGLFRKIWVSSPSSTLASDGLGPLFNARGCQSCHLKDGRGHPPVEGEEPSSIFLRVSVPAGDDEPMTGIEAYLAALDGHVDRDRPDPVYGLQLQNFAVQGQPAEYRLGVEWAEEEIALSDGESASLRRPVWRADNLGYGPLGEGAMTSPRVAPQMIGLGLLEAIPAGDILAHEDPDDADGDGISGRANIVWSEEFGQPMLGRFGLKAGMPTIKAQSAGAFSGDIGISSPMHAAGWGECTAAQDICRGLPDGGGDARGTEIDGEGLDLVTFYSRNLAVPARRDIDDPEVLRGKEVFYATGCTSCHVPKFVTARLKGRDEQSFQLIWPYTDLLLHDMGEGLADNRPEFRANGREWRTAPLWGIGLTRQVSGHSFLLHDGRARSLLEAVLWHGGEAEAQKQAVIDMPAPDRAALIRYLESL